MKKNALITTRDWNTNVTNNGEGMGVGKDGLGGRNVAEE